MPECSEGDAFMNVLKSLALAFACFSRIPMPRVDWDADNMRFMMVFFPFVGIVSGAFVALWCWISLIAGFGVVLRSIGIALVPIAITGAIHLDGFADVIDALSSHAEPERKREILKDPHVGAFAIVGVVAYLLVYVGMASEIDLVWPTIAQLAIIQVVVRCESGIASVAFGGAKDGMLASFRTSADKRSLVALVIEFLIAGSVLVVVSPLPGAIALGVGIICFALLYPFARHSFGGMSGDVAGFFLEVCELLMVSCIALF